MKIYLKRTFYRLLPFFIIAWLTGCVKIKTPEAKLEREKWIDGFSDSIEFYKKRLEDIDLRLKEVNTGIQKRLENFEYINNPREVTGYYLLKGWGKKIPFKSTGIYARVSQNEKLELIATLSDATFNQIAVGPVYSEMVPNDQAFNYRHSGYNTVYFSGGKADTIAQYIASHRQDKITLEFIENSKKKNFILPDDEKNMISDTWNLFEQQQEAHQLQKEFWICSRKIDTFRRFQENRQQQ